MENLNLIKDILEYCEKEKLYFGEGNPNAKILIIGKEIGYGSEENKKPSLEDILEKSEVENVKNLQYWHERLENNYVNNYLKDMEKLFKEKPNQTWGNYQKIVNGIKGNNSTEKQFDFLNDCFITELSQISLPNSDYLKEIKADDIIRKNSVEQRENLFRQSFFQKFPIIIMACGHYPTTEFNKKMYGKYEFDIEEIFNVEYTGNIEGEAGNYYNIHYGKTNNGNDKILIHTRQASMGVTNELLSTIANLCKEYNK